MTKLNLRRTLRFGLTATAVISSVVLLAGCASGADASAPGKTNGESTGAKSFKIGVAWPNLNDPFFAQIKAGMDSEAKGSGIDIVNVDAANDETKQLDEVNQLLSQGIDGLVLAPIEAASAISAVQAAHAAGVPVVTLDRPMPDAVKKGLIASHIGAPAYLGGKLEAQFICSKVPNAKILGVWGPAGSSTSNERTQGFKDEMKNDAKCDGARLLEQMNTESQEQATNVVQGWLQKYPDGSFDAIASFSDPWAAGALQAVQQANRNVMVTGAANYSTFAKAVCDGIPQAAATIDFQNAWVGQQIIKAAVSLRDHGKGSLAKSYDAHEVIVTAKNCANYPYVH